MNGFYKELLSQRDKALELCKLYKNSETNLQYYKIDLYAQLLNIAFKNISNPDELPKVFNIYSKYFNESFIKYLLGEFNISADISTVYSSIWYKCFKVSLIDSSFQKEDQISIANNTLEGLILIRDWWIEHHKDYGKNEKDMIIDVYSRLLDLAFTNYSNPDQFPESFYFEGIGLDFSSFCFHIENVLKSTKVFDTHPNIKLINEWSYRTDMSPHSFDYFVKLDKKRVS